jgi:hypothetical protein
MRGRNRFTRHRTFFHNLLQETICGAKNCCKHFLHRKTAYLHFKNVKQQLQVKLHKNFFAGFLEEKRQATGKPGWRGQTS